MQIQTRRPNTHCADRQARKCRSQRPAGRIEDYDRIRDLPRLIPVMPRQLLDMTTPARRHILWLLARALKRERNLGHAGHWTYDLNRHIALAQACAAERRDLAEGVTSWCGDAAGRGPSSSPAPNGQPHSWARPSDNQPAGPTSRGTLPAKDRSECEGDA